LTYGGGHFSRRYSSRVHRIALFAARDILPYEELTHVEIRLYLVCRRGWTHDGGHCSIKRYEELTYDYGYVVGSVEGKTLRCLCGAPACRGYLF
jgi:SET domain-containing protein